MAVAAAATSLLRHRHRKPPAPLSLFLRVGIFSSRALPQQSELSSSPSAPSDPASSSVRSSRTPAPAAPSTARTGAIPPHPTRPLPPPCRRRRHPLRGATPHGRFLCHPRRRGAQGDLRIVDGGAAVGGHEAALRVLGQVARRRHGQAKPPRRRPVQPLPPRQPHGGPLPPEMLGLAEQIREFEITPNTTSHNLVLKSMVTTQESEGAEKLIERNLYTTGQIRNIVNPLA